MLKKSLNSVFVVLMFMRSRSFVNSCNIKTWSRLSYSFVKKACVTQVRLRYTEKAMVMLRDQFCLLAQEIIWRRHFSLHEFLTLTTKPVCVERWNWKCFIGFVGNRSTLEQLLIYILNTDSFIRALSYYVIQSSSFCILFVAEKLKKMVQRSL